MTTMPGTDSTQTADARPASSPIGPDAPPAAPTRARRSGAWVAIVATVLGLVLALGLGGSAFAVMFGSLRQVHVTDTVVVPARERVVVDANFAAVTLSYSGVGSDAVVFAEANTDRGSLPVEVRSDDGALRVSVVGSGDWRAFENLKVHITLPEQLAATAEVNLSVGAGFGQVQSRVGTLTATVASGVVEATGAAEASVTVDSGVMSLTGQYETVDLRAKSGVVELTGQVMLHGALELGSGVGSVNLGGTMPAEFRAAVTSGFLEFTVPNGDYQIQRSGLIDIGSGVNPDGGANTPKIALSVNTGVISIHGA